MRKLLPILIFLPFLAFAQNINFSEDYSIKSDVAYYLIDDMDGSFVLFRDIPRERKIHIMDDKMMDAGEAPIEFEFKNPNILDVVKAKKNTFSVIYSVKKKGNRYLRIENFDKVGMRKDTFTISKNSNLFEAANFQIEKSEDETKVLIYNVKFDKTIDAILVDVENLKVLWEKSFDDLDINQFFQIKQFVVSNSGNFCLVTLKDNSNLKKEKIRFELYLMNPSENKPRLQKISMKENLCASSLFKFDELNNNLIGTGLYSIKNTIRSQGTFHINIPLSDTKAHKLTFNKFSEAFMKEYLRKKKIGPFNGINSAEIRDIVLRKDGGILLMVERVDTKQRGGTSLPIGLDNQEGIKADFYYDQVFISSIHPDGKEHWTEIIQKKQYSFDDGGIYSSFFQFVSKNGLHLIFNDEIRTHSTISDFNIKGNGKYTRRAIINTIGVDIKLRVRDALQISANEIVIPSQYRNKLRMVKFEF